MSTQAASPGLRHRAAVLAFILAILATMVAIGRPHLAGATMPGLNGRIAFVYTPDGHGGDIYTASPDGSDVRQLTFPDEGEFSGDPAWSPDGSKIAFMGFRDGLRKGIFVMNADGSDQTRLTTGTFVDLSPTWSPDGRRIAFTHATITGGILASAIFVMDADGSNQTRLSSGTATDEYPSWSPDGRQLAFNSDRDGNNEIYVVNADGSGETRLTETPDHEQYPDWSPDGSKIAFSTIFSASAADVFVMDANGSNVRNLSNDPSKNLVPGWSPDGRSILFQTNRNGTSDIYAMNADGSNQRPVLAGGGVEGSPDWQPLDYPFTGFLAPVDNQPAVNRMQAGRGVPVKFNLGGDQGLGILVAGYPKSQQIACDSSAPVDGVEETVSAGSSSLTYDSATDAYDYVWKTDKAWARTCRELIVRLIDGTEHRASFSFTK